MFTGGDSWGEEVDYYNDQPGKRPPSPSDQPPQYSTPNNLLVSSYISKCVCVLHMVQPIHAEEVTLKMLYRAMILMKISPESIMHL